MSGAAPSRSCDVVVIGGGPAGSAAATTLAGQGYEVVLLERARHPRPCVGESLIPHFWSYADELGVSAAIEREGFVQRVGGTVRWGGVTRQMRFADFGHSRPALHVERDRFDEILLRHAEAAGCKVEEGVAATEVDLGDAGRPGVAFRHLESGERGEIRARFVIDASGQASLLARGQGDRQIDEGFRFVALWGYFAGSRYVGAGGRICGPEALQHTPPTTYVSELKGGGWLWHIPLRERTSVGWVIRPEELQGLRRRGASLDEAFEAGCRALPLVGSLLESADYCRGSVRVIRDYSFRPHRVADSGYYRIGDAAGFVDPIFSIGIVLALYSARLAAWAIDRSLRNPARREGSATIFRAQIEKRLGVSRSLALPEGAADLLSPDAFRAAIASETPSERELMCAVAELTARSGHLLSRFPEDEVAKAVSRIRVLRDLDA